jgi:hypothetical protein
MPHSGLRFLGSLALLVASSTVVVSASPNQLFLDFDTDGDLWTINPYASDVPVSLIVQIGDDPISPGSGVYLFFELGCYYDPESMEGRNCAWIDCGADWGEPGVLLDSWVDCPPLAACWDALLMGYLDPALAPQPGERYRLGMLGFGGGGGSACAGSSYRVSGECAGSMVESNEIWPDNPASAPTEDEGAADPTSWGGLKARFRR